MIPVFKKSDLAKIGMTPEEFDRQYAEAMAAPPTMGVPAAEEFIYLLRYNIDVANGRDVNLAWMTHVTEIDMSEHIPYYDESAAQEITAIAQRALADILASGLVDEDKWPPEVAVQLGDIEQHYTGQNVKPFPLSRDMERRHTLNSGKPVAYRASELSDEQMNAIQNARVPEEYEYLDEEMGDEDNA